MHELMIHLAFQLEHMWLGYCSVNHENPKACLDLRTLSSPFNYFLSVGHNINDMIKTCKLR